MWKLNFVLARPDSFPPGIWLELHTFSLDFSLQAYIFAKLKIDRFSVNYYYYFFFVLFQKTRRSRSQMFFKIGIFKNFAVFIGKHQRWSLFLIILQTGRPAKRHQYRCFPVNIAKFLRTPFLQNYSGGCFCKMRKFYKDIC